MKNLMFNSKKSEIAPLSAVVQEGGSHPKMSCRVRASVCHIGSPYFTIFQPAWARLGVVIFLIAIGIFNCAIHIKVNGQTGANIGSFSVIFKKWDIHTNSFN